MSGWYKSNFWSETAGIRTSNIQMQVLFLLQLLCEQFCGLEKEQFCTV